VAEPTQTSNGAAHTAVPDASTEQSISSGPISNEANNTQAHETTPPKAEADTEARDTSKAPLIPLADSVSPPVPAKDASVVNMPGPTSQETSTPPAQTTQPEQPQKPQTWIRLVRLYIAPLSEGDAAAAAKSDNPDLDLEAVAKKPTALSGADDIHTTSGVLPHRRVRT